jgi:hypothetical protein
MQNALGKMELDLGVFSIEYNMQLLNNFFYFFYDIYINHASYSKSSLLDFIKDFKNLNDFSENLTLGPPHVYFISENHIQTIISFKEELYTSYSQQPPPKAVA